MLDTYAHLLDEGVGEPLDLDGELTGVSIGGAGTNATGATTIATAQAVV